MDLGLTITLTTNIRWYNAIYAPKSPAEQDLKECNSLSGITGLKSGFSAVKV